MATEMGIEQLAAGGLTTDFTQLLKPHLAFLQRYAVRLTGNPHDGEDLLQDVLLKVYQQRERLLDLDALQPWLARVMYHQFIDQYRRHRAGVSTVSLDQCRDDEGDHPAWDVADEAPTPEGHLQLHESATALSGALQRLPKEVREVVHLHELEGLSLPEISQRLAVSVNTIKSRLRRARHTLRESLTVTPGCVAQTATLAPEAATRLQKGGSDAYHAWV